MSKNALYLSILILVLAAAGCSGAPTATATPLPPTPPPTAVPATAVLSTATAAPPTATATMAPSATATLEPTATFTPAPTDTVPPTNTPEPVLPVVPPGMSVERLDPNLFAVREVGPDANIRQDASVASEVLTKLVCGGTPLQLDAVATGDTSGLRWYHLVTGGWMREDLAKTYADAAEAEKAAKAAKCAAPAATSQGQPSDYAPTVAQVWDFTQGPDNLSGTCAGNQILPPYGPMKITPHGNTLELNTKEPTPYTLARVQANVYSFSGPTATGDGTVTMVLTFTGKESLKMSRALVPNSDPACTHTHYYTGVWQWDSP
jgi:hypothetical protein